MKHLVLNYFKNWNHQSFDLNRMQVSPVCVILDHSRQSSYPSYESYWNEKQTTLQGMQFDIQRCDDFDDMVIVLAQVSKQKEVKYDYIGYFNTEEEQIRKIEEYWCERR